MSGYVEYRLAGLVEDAEVGPVLLQKLDNDQVANLSRIMGSCHALFVYSVYRANNLNIIFVFQNVPHHLESPILARYVQSAVPSVVRETTDVVALATQHV